MVDLQNYSSAFCFKVEIVGMSNLSQQKFSNNLCNISLHVILPHSNLCDINICHYTYKKEPTPLVMQLRMIAMCLQSFIGLERRVREETHS